MPENGIMEPDMQQYNHRQGQPVSGLSMAAMICGVIGFPALCCGLLGIPVPIAAVICGHLGVKYLKENPEKTGKGLAIAGLVLGYLSILVLVGSYAVLVNMNPDEVQSIMNGIMERITGHEVTLPQDVEFDASEVAPKIQ